MNKFDQAVIDAYFAYLVTDYIGFMDYPDELDEKKEIAAKMVDEYRNGLRIEYGKKYAKVIKGGSVHTFIQLEDDANFKRGDILKAASWKVPAKNFKRGNILTGDFKNVRWTGA